MRGQPRVNTYLLYRSISADDVNFTASVLVATLPVLYYTDLANLNENGNPPYNNQGIEAETLDFLDTVPAGANFARYQVFAKLDGGRMVNSNFVTLPITLVGALGSMASGADFTFASLAAFLPPSGNSVESIQSGADFTAASFTAIDPDFIDVSLLLHFDAFPFVDSSLNVFTVTNAGGTVTRNTSTPEFGAGCASFPGGGTLTVPLTLGGPLDLSSGDFTVEGWFNGAAQGGGQGIVFETSDGLLNLFYQSANQAFSGSISGVNYGTANGALPLNTWTSWAICVHNNNILLFINGVLVQTVGIATRVAAVPGTWRFSNTFVPYNGLQDEFRVTKGVARYIGNYTPSGPFPNS